MHELAITETLVETIKKECEKNKIKTPTKITIELGILTTYKKESIKFYYDILKKENDLIKNTVLKIKEKKAKVCCNKCKRQSSIKDNFAILCRRCNSNDVKIIEGKEINIEKIDYIQ